VRGSYSNPEGGEIMKECKILLKEEEIPRQWYNIQADLPSPLQPILHPGTGQPIGPQDLAPVFPMNLIEQEVSQERWLDIPDEVLEKLLIWRPTPLRRAYALEKALGTPARIYCKDESGSPPGSHKPNTAIPQAYYNKVFGIKRIATETGAGQWGSALGFACCLFGLECKVYMVRISYDQKPYRRLMMNTWGATCVPSPSRDTQAGRKILEENPDSPGSLGIAISEAVEDALTSKDTRYSLGSVLNHVLMHQTIIGLEAKKQLEKAGETKVDVVTACAGGGSNFGGIALPFVLDKIHGAGITIIPAEPTSCPTMTRAPFVYDHGDTAGIIPLAPMHSLGHNFMPPPIHAGGLRYHGIAPLISQLIIERLIEPRAYNQLETYAAGVLWARTEGTIPAPETNHAIAAVIEEAKRAKEEHKEKVILFCYSGHGLLDLGGYDSYFNGKLVDFPLPEEELRKSLKAVEGFPKPHQQRGGKPVETH
jgi:tryptophan synthase beta chain